MIASRPIPAALVRELTAAVSRWARERQQREVTMRSKRITTREADALAGLRRAATEAPPMDAAGPLPSRSRPALWRRSWSWSRRNEPVQCSDGLVGERTVQPGGHLRQCGQPAEAQPQGGEGRPRRGSPRAAHRGHRCRAALRVGWRAARAGRQRSTDLSHGGSWRR